MTVAAGNQPLLRGAPSPAPEAERAWIIGHVSATSLCAFGIAYLALTTIGFALRVPAFEVALLWPSAGLYLAYLSISRRRYWPRIAAVAFAGELLAELAVTHGLNAPYSFVFPAINATEAICGALIFTWLVPQPWQRRQSTEIVAFLVVVALLTPMLGALFASQVVHSATDSLRAAMAEFGAWWAGDFLGIMLTAPVLGGLILRSTVPTPIPRRDVAFALLAGAVVVATIVMLLGLGTPANLGAVQRLALTFVICLSALVWFALRQEPVVVATTSFVVALTISVCFVDADSPLGRETGQDRYLVEAIQFFVLTCSLSAFLVSVRVFEKRHMRRLMRLRRNSGELLADLATRLSAFRRDELDREIEACLEAVGRYANADRCVIFELDRQRQTISQTLRWVREGVSDSRPISQGLLAEMFADAFEQVLNGRGHVIRREDYPPGSPARAYLEATGARVSVLTPLRGQGQVIGCIALIWTRRGSRSPGDVLTILQSLGQIIGNTVNRARAEDDARRYRDRLRKLAVELNRLDDRIRRDTAIDLHDGAAQSLAVARIKIGQLREADAAAAAALSTIDDLVTRALDEIREVIERMSPTTLYELGLVTALEEYAAFTSEQTGLDIAVAAEALTRELPDDEKVLLYRAARELVTNAVKHAGAACVTVHLRQSADATELEVVDDGSGIQRAQPGDSGRIGTGLGLFSLRERLTHLGGRIDIESGDGGTRVTLTLPFRNGL